MLVRDAMSKPAITVQSSAPLSDVISLMVSNKLSGVPVTEASGRLSGVLSEGDLLRRSELGTGTENGNWWTQLFTSHSSAEIYRRANGRKVSDVMTANAVTIESTDTLADATRLMAKFKVKRLPVMEDRVLVGMLSRADFVKALRPYLALPYEESAISDGEIKKRILAEIRHQKWSMNCGFTVAADAGKITLTGMVPSDDQREAIRVAAENVNGVMSVDDQIEVIQPVPIHGI